ncbi:MAG: RNA 2'-phosphotransferase [Candidatus Omnitrophota bacterium]|nr:MAG: RNA 2'-phosphotransferase [Candidatus Omnitrophota bacterium]
MVYMIKNLKVSNKTDISKFLSYILRHKPSQFGIKLDEYGFADMDEVIKVLKKKFSNIGEEMLKRLVEEDKQARFQIKEGKIRARYGHSIDIKPLGEVENIPGILYHGTARRFLSSILKEGLKPKGRKFVHLSLNLEEAIRVGRRKDVSVVILKIDVKKARQEGIKFWREERVVLAPFIPSHCLSIFKKLRTK